jgi:hypothetical protein
MFDFLYMFRTRIIFISIYLKILNISYLDIS